MNKKMFIVVFVGLILTIAVLSANVPNLIDYQGRLTDASENPLDGSYSIVFSIYDVDTGGTALWSETQTIDVNEGLFQVILGSNTSLSEDLFDGSELWIGINVESDGEMSPRTKIVSVPYSRTDRDWTIDGNDMYSNNSGNIGIGTTSPSHVVEIEGTTSNPLLYINKTGSGRGLKVRTTSACAIWVENAGNHGLRVTQANGDGVHVTNANGDGIEVQSAGGFAGRFNGDGYFSGNVGIGTTSPDDQLTIQGSSYPWITIESTSVEGGGLSLSSSEEEWQIYTENTDLTFWQGDDYSGQERMVIDDQGNVGIGTTNPEAELDVNGNYVWHAPHNFMLRGDGEFSFDFPDGDGNDHWHVWDPVHGSILTATNDGNVGIGTNSPDALLVLQDADDNPWIGFCHADGTEIGHIDVDSDGHMWMGTNDANPLTLFTNNGSDLTLNDGLIGIGTEEPNYTLDIATYNEEAIRIRNTEGDDNNGLAFAVGESSPWMDITESEEFRIKHTHYDSLGMWNDGNNTRLLIDGSGNVGIGTETPARTLHVNDYMRLEPVSDPPDTPSAGDIYFDSDDNKLKCFDGTDWQDCW